MLACSKIDASAKKLLACIYSKSYASKETVQTTKMAFTKALKEPEIVKRLNDLLVDVTPSTVDALPQRMKCAMSTMCRRQKWQKP
jgi:hypothetical protein